MVALRIVCSLQILVYIHQCSFSQYFSYPRLWIGGSFLHDECIHESSLIIYHFSRLFGVKKPRRLHSAA
jgi:hypothetical protein